MTNLIPADGTNPWSAAFKTLWEISHNDDGTQKSLPDGITLDTNISGQIEVKAGGVTATQLASSSVIEGKLSLSDVTTANTSSSKHGYAPKLDSNTTHYLRGDGSWAVPPGTGGGGLSGGVALFSSPGVLPSEGAVGVGRFLFPFPVSLDAAVASVSTAATGASIICDVNLNGTTIFSTQANRPTIAAGAYAVTSQPSPDTTSATTYDYLTVDIDQTGSSVTGADLTVIVLYTRTS